jgi:hypothetical protein
MPLFPAICKADVGDTMLIGGWRSPQVVQKSLRLFAVDTSLPASLHHRPIHEFSVDSISENGQVAGLMIGVVQQVG